MDTSSPAALVCINVRRSNPSSQTILNGTTLNENLAVHQQ